MSKKLKTILLATAVVSIASGAQAQNTADLEARLAALEAMVIDLKSELQAEKAKNADEIDRIENVVASQPQSTVAKEAGDGFMVGDTRLSFGGYVDLDAHVTSFSDGAVSSGSIARDFYIPSVTPIGSDETTATDFTAQATRIYFDAKRDVNGDNLAAHIEMDFLGSFQGNERVSSSFSPRLRRAYFDYKGWRVGQEWSTLQNTSAIPESASFLVASDGMIFQRQPMIRYTNGNWQFALENGDSTVTVNGARVEADSNIIPDLIGRYNFKGDYGNVSVAAIVRQLRLETPGFDTDTVGFGVTASGRVKLGEGDIRFNLAGGEGFGRYIGLNALNGATLDPMTGDLDALPSFGGYVALRQPVGETGRISVGYSGLWADNPDYSLGSANKSVQSVFGAYLWDVAPKVSLGTELMYGTRETEAGAEGDMTRFTFSTKYAF